MPVRPHPGERGPGDLLLEQGPRLVGSARLVVEPLHDTGVAVNRLHRLAVVAGQHAQDVHDEVVAFSPSDP